MKMKSRSEPVDEVFFSDEDEDLFVLKQQPYETVMSIGMSDMLNHLNTKSLTRRSDIIVSSTLSITLSPENDFKPINLATLDPAGVESWVDQRAQYRVVKDHIQNLANIYQ